MGCDLPEAQLWSWIDRDAAELDPHLARCPECRRRAGNIRENIRRISAGLSDVAALPEKIGSYTVKSLLGEGGQALVYEAEQESPRRTVAVKVLRGGRFAGHKNLKHFMRETQTLARLHHPAIATIYEAGRTDDGHSYFAMEMVRGLPLFSFLAEHEPSREQRLELFRKICQAVQYAHDNGVIHRDLKPANILVSAEGEPKILDFGLAHLTCPDPETTYTLTRSGLMSGTPRYMSPEQILGDPADIGAPSDVYALGVILYEMLTGKPPNDAHSFTPETVMAICEEEPVKPRVLDPSLKGDLETIILKALAKDPRLRYPTAAELEADLGRFLQRKPILARLPSPFYAIRKSLLRNRLAASVVTVILLAAAVWLWQAMQPPYDRDRARAELVGLRFQYYLDNSVSRIFRSNALKAPEDYPGLQEAVLMRGLALSAVGEKGLAIKYLGDELQKDPDQWPIRALISELGIVKDARLDGDFLAYALGDPGRSLADSWYLRSFATLDPAKALAWSHNALAHDPDHVLALENVARLGTITGDLDNSLAAVDRLLALGDDRRVQWLLFRSVLYCRLGRPGEAHRDVETVVRERSDYSAGFVARAQIHRWEGNYEEAVKDYTLAIDLSERRGESTAWHFYHRGTPNWILGNLEEAAEDYRTAYRLLARPTFGNVRLALVLFQMGRDTEARQVLAEARLKTDEAWLGEILDCLAGETAPERLVAAAGASGDRVRKLCEAYYYAGEYFLQEGKSAEAREMFRACMEEGTTIDTGNYNDRMSEFELAQWRLSRLDGAGE